MESARAVFKLLQLSVSSQLGERRAVGFAIALELAGIGVMTLSPFLLKVLVDALGQRQHSAFQLWGLVAAFVVTWAGSAPISSLRATQSTRVSSAIGRYLIGRSLETMLPKAVTERDADASRLAARLERLPFSLVIIMDGLIWSSLPLVLQLVFSVILAAAVLPPVQIAALGAVLVAFAAVSVLAAAGHQKVAQEANQEASQASWILGDMIRNGRRVVVNGTLVRELDGVDLALSEKARRQTASSWSLAKIGGLQFLTLTAGLVVLLGLAVDGVENKTMTLGGLVLLQAYLMRMIMPLGSFGFVFSHAGEALANVAEVLRDQDAPRRPAGTYAGQVPASAVVEVRDLSFHYSAGGAGLEGINAVFPRGSVTAIVGANGSGKSTLAQVLAGYFLPDAGQVLINGVDLHDIPPADRHQWVLYVPQMIGLFNRTLAENALYPPTTLSLEDLRARLTAWRFDDANRPVDFALSVGEQGEKLSGGQIQKLELARISGVRSPVVILDESTSALDPAGELRVIEDLKRTFAGRSSLILITHRPACAEAADQVIWMTAGGVAAIGAHGALFESDAGYRRLWQGGGVETLRGK